MAGATAGYVNFAQQQLGEDGFLWPGFGMAALHLDVPFEADVTVSYFYHVDPTDGSYWKVKHTVHRRGRYRDLMLTGLPISSRENVTVTADLPVEDSYDGTRRTKRKTISLMAGDRK